MEQFCFIFNFIVFALAAVVEHLAGTPTTRSTMAELRKHLRAEVLNFVVIKKTHIALPYRKLLFTYHRYNICALTRTEKLMMCIYILSSPRYGYVFSDHSHANLSCRRIDVEIADDGSTASVFAYRCPTPHRNTQLWNAPVPIHSSVSYFISGANIPAFVIVYYRHLGPRAATIPDVVLPRRAIPNTQYLRDFERNKKYEKSDADTRFLYHDVAPYRMQMWSPPTYLDAEYAENYLSYYVQHVKRMKSPYLKFTITNANINACSLRFEKKQALCASSFDDIDYDYDVSKFPPTIIKCDKSRAYFNYVKFAPSDISTITCGFTIANQTIMKSLFLTTNKRPNSVLALVRFHPHEELLPEAVIENITYELPTENEPKEKPKKKRQKLTPDVIWKRKKEGVVFKPLPSTMIRF